MISAIAILPLLFPRITESTGYEYIIYGISFLFIFFDQLRNQKFDIKFMTPQLCTAACILLSIINRISFGNAIDYRLILFSATLLICTLQSENIKLSNILYTFSIISVFLSIPLSIAPSVSFIKTASTYDVAGFERITFFFNEPSHYAIVLALSFGIGMVQKKSIWMQIVLLGGIGLTFSASGFIILFAVYLLNSVGNKGILKTLSYTSIILIVTYFILIPLLIEIDSSEVIATRLDQFVNGVTLGFNYSSIGIRIASALAGPEYLFDTIRAADISSFMFGSSFEGLQDYASMFYQNFFFQNIEDVAIFNFLSASMIFSGLVGTLLYLGAIDQIRRSNRIYLLKWITLIACVSLTHGYLYGPLAFIFLIYCGLSISNLPIKRAS